MPASIQRATPDFEVQVAGQDLPVDAQTDLLGVTVEEDVEALSMFTLQLVNWNPGEATVKWSDGSLFAIGSEVTVRMGYRDNLTALITGDITGLEPEFRSDGLPSLTVRGYDRRHLLQRTRATCSFLNRKDSDIAAQLAGNAGLPVHATDSGVTHDYLLQSNQSDLEFLEHRARRIGYEIAMDGKTLLFRPRQNSVKEAMSLSWKLDLIEFHPRLTTLGQFSSVQVRGWDPKKRESLSSESADGDPKGSMGDTSGPAAAKNGFGAAPTAIVDCPVRNPAEADSLARGVFNEMSLNYITGEGVAVGNPALRAGRVARIDGLGKRFSGLYYVVSTQHSWTAGQGYRTAFQVRRNAA